MMASMLYSIQSCWSLNLFWNHEALLMSWVRDRFSGVQRLSWIRLEIIPRVLLLLLLVLIVDMSSFVPSNLLNIWLMLVSIAVFILIDWVPAINYLVTTIVDDFWISCLHPLSSMCLSVSLSMCTLSSICSLSRSLLNKVSRWLNWLLSLKVINQFFFYVFLDAMSMFVMLSASKSLLMLLVVSIVSKWNFVQIFLTEWIWFLNHTHDWLFFF